MPYRSRVKLRPVCGKRARSKSEAYITVSRFDHRSRLRWDSPCMSIRFYRDGLIKSVGAAIASTYTHAHTYEYLRTFGKQSNDQNATAMRALMATFSVEMDEFRNSTSKIAIEARTIAFRDVTSNGLNLLKGLTWRI